MPTPSQRDDAHALPGICTNSAIRRVARRMGNLYDMALAPSGLRATQYALLVQAERLAQPTMRQLADELVMDLSALGHTVKPLVRDGLLALHANPRDRRSRHVVLTEAGRIRLGQARVLWRRAQDGFEQAFGLAMGRGQSAQLHATLALIASPEFAAQVAGHIGSH